MGIKSMKIHTEADGYPSGSYDKLMDFTDRMANGFDGDLAHLVSYEGGGGIAYVDVICSSWGTGYSGLAEGFSEAPLFSWTVEVIAHELGHNVAAPHTHACNWGPNGNEPVDCCGHNAGYSECACDVPDPTNGGTIMSYCHLTNVGINFNNGFGEWVAPAMRDAINNASCLVSCDTGPDCVTWYADADGDGYGNSSDSIEDCEGGKPAGRVENGEDCDDTDNSKYPEADCVNTDGCSGIITFACFCESNGQVITWYADEDGDLHGDPFTT